MLDRITNIAEAFVRGAWAFPLVGALTIVGTAVGLSLKVKDAVLGRK